MVCFMGVQLVLPKLGDLIKSRKDTILKNLQDADNKFREAEENLAFAKENFELAKSRSEQIRSQGLVVAAQTARTLLDTVEEDIKRLRASNLSAIRFEEEKSINEVVRKFLSFIHLILKNYLFEFIIFSNGVLSLFFSALRLYYLFDFLISLGLFALRV